MKTISTLLIVLILIVILSFKVKAQACGQGVYTLEFYTLDGDEKKDIDFEILPINSDSLEFLFSKYTNLEDQLRFNSNKGTVLQSRLASRIIGNKQQGLASIKNYDIFKMEKFKGKLDKSRVEFNTVETYYELFLLKLMEEDKEVYIVGNFFGGCNRTIVLLWNDRPRIVEECPR